jgi:hypothetical protein
MKDSQGKTELDSQDLNEKMRSEYEEFLNYSENVEISSKKTEAIYQKFSKDLVSSPSEMGLKYLGLSLVGYFVSLSICAQNSLGVSSWSHQVAETLHQLPRIPCAILCGAVFTGTPFFLSFFLLNRFQQRYLLFKLWWLIAAIPLLSTFLMLILPVKLAHSSASRVDDHLFSGDWKWIAMWTASSIATPYVLEIFVYLGVRKRKSKGIILKELA